MKLYFLPAVILLINVFLLSSCKKYTASDAAFFIRANPISIKTNTLTQGSGSNKITDLFLYVNGNFQGVYPAGNLMPIITKNQKVTINAFAGIKNNGISSTRISWTFYNYITLDTLVESGKTIDYPFTFSYAPGVIFEWIEDFDSQTHSGYTIRVSDSNFSNTKSFKIAQPSDCFEGKSIEMDITGDSLTAQLESNIGYPLPIGSSDVYLELNYKCTIPFSVGVIADSDPATLRPAVVVNAQPVWNKIYIELANVVSQAPVGVNYKIYFAMLKTDPNTYPKMFLDNIKLVHF